MCLLDKHQRMVVDWELMNWLQVGSNSHDGKDRMEMRTRGGHRTHQDRTECSPQLQLSQRGCCRSPGDRETVFQTLFQGDRNCLVDRAFRQEC